jgi:hypothetical protein
MPSLAEFQQLPLTPVTGEPQLPQPVRQADLTDPALSLMTDLRLAPCVRVHMAFVAGVGGEPIGLVTADDLQGERPLRRAAADHVGIGDLVLEHVMTPLSDWQVVDAWQVEHSRVGNVAATMRRHGLRYLVVAERGPASTRLCGLFSARRLEQALGVDLSPGPRSRSFAELEAALH